MRNLHIKSLFIITALIAASFTFTNGPKPKKKKAKAKTETVAAPVDEIVKADTIAWYNFNDGFAKAKKQGKILVIDTYTDWCGWCKKMDHDTYENPDIIAKMNQYCIAVKFNPENNGSYNINGKIYNQQQLLTWLAKGSNRGYPTTFIWVKPNADEKVYMEVGYRDATDFNTTLNSYIALK
ncbi:MAG: DUF255 domain-containing protein [Bacteroidia bacterium]|nr:DUF255 domain-containing protein [Bacteroidia bacterium]